jgi:hypothetical protein
VFRESLGTTVERILAGDAVQPGRRALRAIASYAEDTEYADVGAQIFEAAAVVAPPRFGRVRYVLRQVRDWMRRHYGLREIILPEKYRVDARNAVVVTYSSCLAQLYFADDLRPLTLVEVARDPRRTHLYTALLAHPGIGLIATRTSSGIHVEGRGGRAILRGGIVTVAAGTNPLHVYGSDERTVRAVESLVHQPNGGDLVLFGAYDGREIVSFDDQVGAHGCVGGDQAFPFLIAPAALDVQHAQIDDARDIHRVIMSRYAVPSPGPSSATPSTDGAGDGDGGGADGAGAAARGSATSADDGAALPISARNSSPVNRSASASTSDAPKLAPVQLDPDRR